MFGSGAISQSHGKYKQWLVDLAGACLRDIDHLTPAYLLRSIRVADFSDSRRSHTLQRASGLDLSAWTSGPKALSGLQRLEKLCSSIFCPREATSVYQGIGRPACKNI